MVIVTVCVKKDRNQHLPGCPRQVVESDLGVAGVTEMRKLKGYVDVTIETISYKERCTETYHTVSNKRECPTWVLLEKNCRLNDGYRYW